MPSKLEDKVSPQDLLSAMRQGTLKNALAKKYKASDEDFAMMLYPMYRRGELTKQEFNDFFNLVALTSATSVKEAPSVGGQIDHVPLAQKEPEDIFRTITANLDLSPEDLEGPYTEDVGEVTGHINEEATFEELPDFVVERNSGPVVSEDEAVKSLVMEPPARPKVPKGPKPHGQPPLGPFPQRQLSLVRETPEKSAAAEPALKAEKTLPREQAKREALPPPRAISQEHPEPKGAQPTKDAIVAKPPEGPLPAQRPVDWKKIKAMFESISTRLNSIEARLARIEKKLTE